MNAPDLKPCPFCARKPIMLVSSLKMHDYATGQWRKLQKRFFVRCEKCHSERASHASDATAIAAWNRRASDRLDEEGR